MICFAGKFEKNVDAKHRINIPALLVNQVSSKTFNITRGQDHNLFVYPLEVFIEKAQKLNKSFGSRGEKDREKRLYFQETMADAQPVQCDQQGRLIIPEEFLDFAEINDRVLIIGAYEKLILWNPELYKAFIESSEYTEEERVHQFGWAENEED